MNIKNFSVMLLLVVILFACSPASPSGTATEGPDLNLTSDQATENAREAGLTSEAQEAAAAEQTQEAANARATQDAEETASAEATAQAEAESATLTAVAQATAAQATQEAEEEAARAASTAQAIQQATAQAQPMTDQASALFEQGVISQAEGTFIPLPDYDYSWAQLNWYNWLLTGLSPTDFILQADLSWESASDTADWWNSGCGFAFRINDDGDHYLTYLGLDGNFGLYRNINQTVSRVGTSYAGPVDLPAGSATVMIVAEGKAFTFYVNGERIHTRQDSSLQEGALGYVLVSGTNKDYGTWCQWENVQLWALE